MFTPPPFFNPPQASSTQYLAIAHDSSPRVSIYKRQGDVLTKLTDPASLPGGDGTGAAFSLDGSFLAISHYTSPYITVYSRSGDVFTKLSNPGTLPTGNANGVAWSPDGSLLAVAHFTSPYVTIYQRSGTTFTKLTNPGTLPAGDGRGCAFSADGQFLAVAHTTTPFITIYSISGTTFTKLADPATLPGALQPGMGCAFSPDGAFLAVASGSQTQSHTIYSISGTTFTKIADPSMPAAAFDASWSADSSVLVLGHIYDRSGSTFTLRTRSNPGGLSFLGDDISADGMYVGVAGFPSPYILLYRKNGATITALTGPTTIPTGTGRGAAWGPLVEAL